MLTADDVPKLTDFGLAKRLDVEHGQTRTGSVMGTPGYMAPEQAEGRTGAIGPLSDVYGLGAVLYDMLVGRPPFRGDTPMKTLQQVIEHDPVAPRLLNPHVPRDLETICLKCLEKDSTKRYQSAGALADELQRFQRGEPIEARPISRVARVWRWCRRKPTIASLAAAAAASLLVALSASTIGYLQTSAALTKSRAAQQESDESFRDALDAVNNLYTRVSQDNAAKPTRHAATEGTASATGARLLSKVPGTAP
jgi:serine/threonine protein kinase